MRQWAPRRLEAKRAQAREARSTAMARRVWGPGKRSGGRLRGAVKDGAVVVTSTVTLVPGFTVEGEIEQLAATGIPPQVRATGWLNPPTAFTSNEYFAVWPGRMVADVGEPGDVASAKSCPAPVSETVCGLLLALSVIDSVPLRLPVALGVKVTLMVQLAPGASELGQVLVWAKSPLVLKRIGPREPSPVSVKVRV